MSVTQQVTALTGALRSNFWQAWKETAVVCPNEPFTTRLTSTTRIENWPQFTPAPAMQEFDGSNDYGTISSYIYSIQNKVYSTALMFDLYDLEDDQTGALAKKPAELAMKAKLLENREVMKCLASGRTGTFPGDGTVYGATFDGLNFFANRTGTNGFGTGNNVMPTYTSVSNGSGDTSTHQIIGIYHGPQCMSLKPLIWQHRAGPTFRTNAGSDQSDESLQVRMWARVRGKAAYGIWYTAILQPILGKPNQAEVNDILANMEATWRTFQLPKSRSTSFGEYVFEQTEFDSSNTTYATDTALSQVMRVVLTEGFVGVNIPQTSGNNTVAITGSWKGRGNLVVSAYLNSPVLP